LVGDLAILASSSAEHDQADAGDDQGTADAGLRRQRFA